MEKNQHNNSTQPAEQQNDSFTGDQPGQQPAANANQSSTSNTGTQDQPERHSESSFPTQDGETLGTP